jgi:UDP-GlcNAc3NAcA epimerase
MKVVSIVGARPQLIKAAAVSRVLRRRHAEMLLHTGQHYDHEMSDVFFEEFAIDRPAVNLGVGSGLHGEQTAAMLVGIERVLLRQRPDWVVVYGDTNSTLAGRLPRRSSACRSPTWRPDCGASIARCPRR